jgi:Tripartite tricarboxylate transporter TctB family
MLAAVGVGAVLLARDIPFGTSLRMGPGYFPTVLGATLALFGGYFIVRSLRASETLDTNWSLRALIGLTVSLILFGVLIDRAGFVPALVVLIFGSAASGTEFKFGEVLALTAILTVFAVVLFIYAIGLPYPLIAGF